MSTCTFFIKAPDTPPNLEELKGKIASNNLEEKTAGVKTLIRCMSNDETFPPIIMHIITNVIPQQHKSNELRKAMLLYWEIVEKSKSPTDKSLKEEVFLACNSLRNDLIGHNEFVRGRTLRLVSRIMHKGVIEPLAGAISKNLGHGSAYVRRNAVICLYNIFMHYQSDIIGEIDDQIEELLKTQTDLSTKRNAFLLLNKTDPKKAMEYLQLQIKNQSVDEIGDILQLAILKILKIKCKEDPTQKARLLKMVHDFQEKGTDSVRLECAITGTAISNSASTIKNSLNTYVNILGRTSEINVNKIILDKLQIICKNSNYLQDDVIEDLLKGMKTPSTEIKIKIVDIVMTSVSSKSSQMILKYLQKDPLKEESEELVAKVMCLLELITFKYFSVHRFVIEFIDRQLLGLKQLNTESVLSLSNTFKMILKGNGDTKKQLAEKLISNVRQVQSSQILTIILNQLSTYLSDTQQIQSAISQFQEAVGELPLSGNQEEEESKETVVKSGLRTHLINDSILGGVFARSVAKLLYKIRKGQSFNLYACPILMILCSLLRNYQKNLCFVDQAVIDQMTVIIRKIVNPDIFVAAEDPLFETVEDAVVNFTFNEKRSEMIEKNPDDLIHFRLLRKGDQVSDFDYDEEEVNDILEQVVEKVDYISKLKSLVQLTGSFDPLYAEAFINVNKYDLFFEILLINNTKSNLLNVQIQFSSTVEVLVLEKAQSVNLRPFESVMLRTQLRFCACEFGVVYGYINYDSQAGLQQPYLITEEIKIDYMQYIEPALISKTNFKIEWQKAENEVIYQSIIPLRQGRTFKSIIQVYEKIMHARLVEDIADSQNKYFLNCHLFGTSKLGDNFYINLALFSGEELNLSITIRSKDKAVKDIIYKELLHNKFTQIEEGFQ